MLLCRMRTQMCIGCGMLMLQQFSGINAVVFYRCFSSPNQRASLIDATPLFDGF